jgi:hypothetical protein
MDDENQYVLCTKATVNKRYERLKLDAPMQMAKEIDCPYYFVLAKAEVNPTKPGN